MEMFLSLWVLLHIHCMIAWSVDGSRLGNQCQLCGNIVNNFMKGYNETSRMNFGGGNTNWEEKNLGKYSNSESRLNDILEHVCMDESKKDDCHLLLEQAEEFIEEWWKQSDRSKESLRGAVCIQGLRVCCPDHQWGRNCQDCPGGKDNLCGGHGSCTGGGTRTGSGTCSCDAGYQGLLCEVCKPGYYRNSTDTTTDQPCKACHAACDSVCFGEGPKACDRCRTGWQFDGELGCTDQDECLEESRCGPQHFCANTVGSFTCHSCDSACDGCTAAGPSACRNCQSGYELDDGVCKDFNECTDGDETVCPLGQYCINVPGKFSCSSCDPACVGGCSGPGLKSCYGCSEGYEFISEQGCVDVNECSNSSVLCPNGKYCLNRPGSYECADCNPACSACFADGVQSCTKCSLGYEMTESQCTDINECLNKPCLDKNKSCINTVGSFRCSCRSGFVMKDGVCVKDTNKDSKPAGKLPGLRNDDDSGEEEDDGSQDEEDDHDEL